jgi:rhodanese-related sulfurtransferase
VRSPEDFRGEQGHIHGAYNIPLEDLPARMGELTDRLERPLAIVCRTDRRSAKAALLLTEDGFADVHIVAGGMTRWNAAGFPIQVRTEAHGGPA